MSTITTTELRDLVCEALRDGATLEEVEYELLDPARLPLEEHDALWLYALARSERPRPTAITLISN